MIEVFNLKNPEFFLNRAVEKRFSGYSWAECWFNFEDNSEELTQ